jgi:NAD+-dependent secondary alcohol dehydrogenase Adh1
VELETIQAIARELTVLANLVGTYDELVELVGLSEHQLHSEVDRYGLSEAKEVFHKLEAGQVKGRAVLVP